MILVDSSVWIRFIRGQEPFLSHLRGLLKREEVAGHDFVYGELLIGDRGGRSDLLKSYQQMRQLPGVPHKHVAEFVKAYRLHGVGIGWVDAHLLASALVAHSAFWSADERLAKLAQQFGIAYRPDSV